MSKPKIASFPAYAYIEDQNRQVTCSFTMSDELYERYKDYGGGNYSGTIEHFIGTYPDPVKVINDYFNGIELVGGIDFPYYVKRTYNDIDMTIYPNTVRYTEYKNLIAKINANVTELFYDSVIGNYDPVSLVNNEEFYHPLEVIPAGYFGTRHETVLGDDVLCFTHALCMPLFQDQLYIWPSLGLQRPIIQMYKYIYPEDIINGYEINQKYTNNDFNSVRLVITIEFEQPILQEGPVGNAKEIKIILQNDGLMKETHVVKYLTGVDLTNSLINVTGDDPDNPYSDDDTSGPGGGDGSGGDPDILDPVRIPSIPSISAADLGFISMYNPSVAQLQSLAAYLWSSGFDLNNLKKLFVDPMDACIGLAIVPVSPTTGGSKNVQFGNIDSGISMPYLTTNYVKFDCGWLPIQKYIGSFLDFTDTRISIYLPYIGIRELSPDDVMGGSLHVAYIIDVLTGACACFIEEEERGVLYTYNGSCITNVPLTANNFSGAIQNAVSAVVSGIGAAAGMVSGAAPLTAMGAVGLLNTASNAVMNSKQQIQRSGNLGGSAGIMSVQTPYVIIERPRLSVPNNMQHFVGQTSNISNLLGYISGFTMVEYVHIENCTGTSEEIAEIESLLKQGVYL